MVFVRYFVVKATTEGTEGIKLGVFSVVKKRKLFADCRRDSAVSVYS